MKASHYTLDAYSARHAVFSSHHGECIVIDRKSGETAYTSGFDGQDTLSQALRAANARRLDLFCEPHMRQRGGAELNICALADVSAVLAELDALNACRRAASRH